MIFTRHSSPLLASSFLSCLVLVGCGGGGAGGKDPLGGKCQAPDDVAPELESLGDGEFPTSHLWVHARVPLSSVKDRISKEIPRTLAKEKDRDVGAPGKATYRVTRGEPNLSIENGKVTVGVPVFADISVCKPIGRMCIGYGSCKPEFSTEFSFASKLGDKYELSPPKGKISATKRCIIAVDVTEPIEKIARQEVKKVERQIAAEWPKLMPQVKRGFAELQRPFGLSDDRCFFVEPQAVEYSSPRIVKDATGEYLEASAGVAGLLLPAESCSSEQETPAVLPPQLQSAPAEQSLLYLPDELPWDDVRTSLTTSLQGPWAGEDSNLIVEKIEFSASRLALRLRTDGPLCGSYWVTADYGTDESGKWFILKNPRLSGGKAKQPDQARLEALFTHVGDKGRLLLSPNPLSEPGSEEGLSNLLRLALPQDVKFSISPVELGEATIQGTRSGLLVARPIRSVLSVNDL